MSHPTPTTYIIEEDTLLELLNRTHKGETPGLVLAEYFAYSIPVETDQ